ncbi:MAG: hypothetical protein RIQ53_2821 [Pseudomonadota bacterium]
MAFDAEFDDDALADGPEPADAGGGAPWAVFGDLMTGMLGAFVLLVVWLIASQLDLTSRLQAEQQLRQAEQARRQSLEQALAGPLAGGRVTLRDGRIGINGSVLFASGSHELQPEGRELLRSLAGPLAAYLARREELLMVSGYTDDRLLRQGQSYADNWELSAQRALTVTRTLIEAGLPAERVFTAAFGPQQPVASNDSAEGRALNRRVEIAPVPRQTGGGTAGAGAGTSASAGAAAATPRTPGDADRDAPRTDTPSGR